MDSKKYSIKTERFYSAHHSLLIIAKENLNNSQKKEFGNFNNYFTAIALSSLAIEALCNAVGEKVIHKWIDFESCSPAAKIRLICEHLSIGYDAAKEPWGTLVWLCKTRNLIAHPKAESIICEDVITSQEHDSFEYGDAPSKLEKRITLENAKKSVASVESLIELFCEKLSPEQCFGISADMWNTTSTAHCE